MENDGKNQFIIHRALELGRVYKLDGVSELKVAVKPQ